jgi:outer membrane receptor protein involved in Fe transport
MSAFPLGFKKPFLASATITPIPKIFGYHNGKKVIDKENIERKGTAKNKNQINLVKEVYYGTIAKGFTHPDTNEYAGFVQDTIRASDHLALSLGVRYDLQTFTTKGLHSNPLWPDAGRVPYNTGNFAPTYYTLTTGLDVLPRDADWRAAIAPDITQEKILQTV